MSEKGANVLIAVWIAAMSVFFTLVILGEWGDEEPHRAYVIGIGDRLHVKLDRTATDPTVARFALRDAAAAYALCDAINGAMKKGKER